MFLKGDTGMKGLKGMKTRREMAIGETNESSEKEMHKKQGN
jgi:hypothetical protein